MRFTFPVLLALSLISFTSCTNRESGSAAKTDTLAAGPAAPNIRSEPVGYSLDTAHFTSYIAYDARKSGRRPIVLVVPEWWGLNDYARRRADQLAELGYFAVAVDMYGGGRTAANPDEAMKMSGPFYANTELGNSRLLAALDKAKSYPQADTSQTAAIGYCFGGAMVLNAARTGLPFLGVVSFHGGLMGARPNKDAMHARILVCHGAADQFVPASELAAFRKQMDSVGAQYTIREYPNATHAFTNPDATEKGKQFHLPIAYNPAADSASWNEMRSFFGSLFRQQ